MCGLFAYVGQGDAVAEVLAGLIRLEYRGYDSWGIAFNHSGEIATFKDLGPISDTVGDHEDQFLPHATACIGHTRWATHGAVSLANCHPHLASGGGFALCHNGIVENYQELRERLDRQDLTTDTDTEVIVRLIESHLAETGDIRASLVHAFRSLKGRNTLIVLVRDQNRLLGVRNGSPLVVSELQNAYCLSSDSVSMAELSNRLLVLEDGQLIDCVDQHIEMLNITPESVQAVRPEWATQDRPNTDTEVHAYQHFMLKEIHEQWSSLADATRISAEELHSLIEMIAGASTVFVCGAGGASYAAGQIALFLKLKAGVYALPVPAYEVGSFEALMQSHDVLLAVSQSGETADTIEAAEIAKSKGLNIVSLTNMRGSSLERLSDLAFFSNVGVERCVLSTKSASAQIAFGYLLARAVSGDWADARARVDEIINYLSVALEPLAKQMQQVAARIVDKNHIFVLGRKEYLFPALIGALNIKEASYIHAEAFAAGELKHGVIALIEDGVPVILFAGDDDTYMISVAAQVKSRGAFVIAIGRRDNELFDEFVELAIDQENDGASIISIVPCQLLAYHLAVMRGLDPDRPRNLAKSVTVK